ncbi:MAG TPA: AAA family ATPase [Pilimelia sp.]|nr:AAA family ATPase [Pilimelia sp.]
MATRLGEVLDRERHRNFVGRRRELAGFDEAIAGRSPHRVLLVHGPGGIGKTTLLLELRTRARAARRTVALLDGREVDASPEGFVDAVAGALGRPGDGRATELPADAVLLVDGYEHLAPIDSWLRHEFVPALAAEAVVVLAGRDAPAAAWRLDAGWRHVVAALRLDPFDPAESGQLLALAGVAAPERSRLIALGRGHPLAMALLADVARSGVVPESLADVPALVSALLDPLLRGAPTQAHVTGLATCAKAWLTTEDLLRDVVGADAPAVWAWLEQRPFIVSGPRGLTPHDLARDVLDAEFERRSPERYRALHRVVHDHVVGGLRAATGADRQLQGQHLMYLHRRAPFTAAVRALRAQGSTAVVPARPAEHDEVLSLVERFEGPESARLAAGWLAEQADGLSVVRADEGVGGYAYHVFHPTGSTLEERDPVARAALDHVAAHGPTRPGEQVNVARFFGGRGEHQRDLYAVLAGSVSSLVVWLTRPLAWSFVIVTDTAYWAPIFDYLGFAPLIEAEFGGRRHVGYGVDWRRLPVDAWLDLMNEREHSGGTGPPPASLLRPPPLDRATFGAAVRAALPDLQRPDRLATNLLTTSSLADGPGSLRATIETAIDCLREEPKGAALSAVLQRTFVRGAPTQEAAAEVLGLPFSTYRRHLGKAIEQLTDLLWAVEIGEVRMSRRLDSD